MVCQKLFGHLCYLIAWMMHAPDEQFSTALQLGDVTLVRSVCERYSNRIQDFLSLTNAAGHRPIHTAARCGSLSLIMLLIKYDALCVYDRDQTLRQWLPLFYATYAGHESIVRFLIAQGAPHDVVDKFGYSLLHVAAERGRYQVMAFLLQHDQSGVSAVNKFGRTPLQEAVLIESCPIVLLLCKASSAETINAPDHAGWTALHRAADAGNDRIVKILIEHDADCCVQESNGYTPMHCALFARHWIVAQRLLAECAWVDIQEEKKGRSPLMVLLHHCKKKRYDCFLHKEQNDPALMRLVKQLAFVSSFSLADRSGRPIKDYFYRSTYADEYDQFLAERKQYQHAVRECMHDALSNIPVELIEIILDFTAGGRSK